MPFLTGILGGLFTWIGLTVKAKYDQRQEVYKRELDTYRDTRKLLASTIAAALSFQAEARAAANKWSVFHSYHLSKVPDADDLRQEFFQMRNALHLRANELVALGEEYGALPEPKDGEAFLGGLLHQWTEKTLAELANIETDYETFYKEQGNQMVGYLRELRAVEDRRYASITGDKTRLTDGKPKALNPPKH